MGELIRFPVPEDQVDRLPQTIEEIKTNVESVRQLYINDMTETLLSVLVHQMTAAGFDVTPDEHNKDLAFLIETVRSTLCKTLGFYHPFQDIAEDLMMVVDSDGVLAISDEVLLKYIMKESDGSIAEESGQDVQA